MGYEMCPAFGTKECCGTWHNRDRARIAAFKLELQLKNGDSLIIEPWVLSEVAAIPTCWVTTRNGNPGLVGFIFFEVCF